MTGIENTLVCMEMFLMKTNISLHISLGSEVSLSWNIECPGKTWDSKISEIISLIFGQEFLDCEYEIHVECSAMCWDYTE